MDFDNIFEINMRINNLKDMLLSDVDMPDDVAEFQISRLKALEAQRDAMR